MSEKKQWTSISLIRDHRTLSADHQKLVHNCGRCLRASEECRGRYVRGTSSPGADRYESILENKHKHEEICAGVVRTTTERRLVRVGAKQTEV